MLSESDPTPHDDIDGPRSDMPTPVTKTAKLQLKEIRIALGESYKPIMNLDEAAALSRLAPKTLYKKVSEGFFKQSVKRGRPLLFWTDRFVQELMR